MEEFAKTELGTESNLDDVAGMALGLLSEAMQREDSLPELEELVDEVRSLLGPISRVADGRCRSRECRAALRVAYEVEAQGADCQAARDTLRRCCSLFDVAIRCIEDLRLEKAADEPDAQTVADSAYAMCVAATLIAYLGLVAGGGKSAGDSLCICLGTLRSIAPVCDRLMLENPGSGWGMLSAQLICPDMQGE